jgi:hypothetical protein
VYDYAMNVIGESNFHGGLVLPTYARPNLLGNCLKSIYSAENSKGIAKIIVLQLGNKEVEKLVYDFQDRQTFVIPVKRINTSPLFNINYNWLVGASLGFEILGLPWLISIEEDSVVKNNSFNFILEMHEKYSTDVYFRGVNLSTKLVDPSNYGTYSKLRSGFMGTGATVLYRDWNTLKKFRIKSRLSNYPWDVFTDAYWKTGYRVTPNISMAMNFGWIQGTHSTPTKSVQQELNQISFDLPDSSNRFKQKNCENGWSADSSVYDPKSNLIFKIRLVIWVLLFNRIFLPVYRRIVHYLYKSNRKLQ